MILANTIIGGRYRVTRPLGGGGMKMVYLAEDLRLAARPCALAEMVDSFTSPETQKQAVAAFQREADMLAQLSNEHIPRVFDRFSDENHHYLVMEFIDGVTLEQRLKDHGGKLGEAEVIDLALQVLDTLDYLHNLEPPVIYRDLKPSNVMMMPSGLVKLIDFGIARLFQPLSNATMIGTQGYAPPEQYRGKVESRSDLYALGATMHHALSGRDPALEPPFSFPPLKTVAPDVTIVLAALVDQALQYDVILRMGDALEFKNRLLAIKNGAPITQAPILTRNSTGSATGERPQMKLPLTGLQYKQGQPASPSAPTILSDAIDAQCPRCGREIPLDSNFCSFCAANVTGRLQGGVANAAPDAQTIFLDEPSEPMTFPDREELPARHRKRNPVRTLLLIIGGAFFIGYLMFRPSSEPDTDTTSFPPPGMAPPDYGGAPPPDATEPAPTEARTIALRRALNSMGYQSVHFKLVGDSIILWGTVNSEADRIMVQTQVFLVARIFSLEDHIQVRNAFAEP